MRIPMDPITAITAATAAFNTVKKFVEAGQDFENTVGQMGKWYTAVSDFRHGQKQVKNPPIFKKLFAAGSVEEEALSLLMHEKKIAEQEQQLQVMLNMRYGYKTWDELIAMRRKIKAQREKTIYKQAERKRAFFDMIFIIVGCSAIIGMLGGFIYWLMKMKGMV